MAQTIQIRRRLGGAAGPPGTLGAGEPAFNDNGNTLHIGGSTAGSPHLVVGAARQVELTGDQTITTGAANAKRFDLTNLKITGSASAGQVLTRGAADGDLSWATPAGIAFGDGLTGDGSAGDPISVDFATDAETATGTATDKALTPANLRAQMGAAATAANLGTTATTVVPAIAELAGRVNVLQSAIRFVGTYNVPSNLVTPVSGGPIPAGALPPADAANEGFMVIATTAGTGTGEAPAVSIAVADLLISDGTDWVLVPLNLGTIAAANVTLTTISGITATNVQNAISELHTAITNVLGTLEVDGTSIVGDGLTAGTALAVGTVDGGTY